MTAVGEAGADASIEPGGILLVRRMEPETIARIALARMIPVHELTPIRPSLEDAYLRLTADAMQYDTLGIGALSSTAGTPAKEKP